MPWKGHKIAEISLLLLKPTPNLELVVNQLNNIIPENNNDTENIFSSVDEMQNVGTPNKNKSLSLFHLNGCSLEDLQYLLSCTKNNFDIIRSN